MKIAITGATGGLGRNLLEKLLADGDSVTALGRDLKIGAELKAQGAQFFPGDLGDVNYLEKAFAGHDAVVHSAALAAPWGRWENFHSANVLGTENVLTALHRTGVRKLVHISTPSVYFSGKSAEGVVEDSPLPEPRTHYARSKRMAEERVLRFARETGVNTTIIRPRAIFGRYDRAILPRLIRVIERGRFPLPGGGQALVDVTAVENVVHGICLCLRSERAWRGEIFNLTNDEPLTVQALVGVLMKELEMEARLTRVPLSFLRGLARILEGISFFTGREPLLTRYSVDLLGTTQTLSIARAKRELGYAPIISVRDALHQYAVWRKGEDARSL